MPPSRRRRTTSLHDRAALGTYRGPQRLTEPPNLTAYRLMILRAIQAGEVRAGTGQYLRAWRHHKDGVHTTVSKTVNAFIACGWATGGPTPALTDAGTKALEGIA